MAKLTAAEQHILRHPPTVSTWICPAKHRASDGVTIRVCGMLNAGSRDTCTFCATKKSRSAKLLWPVYVRAAVKAGIPEEDWGKPLRPRATPETSTGPVKRPRKRGKTS